MTDPATTALAGVRYQDPPGPRPADWTCAAHARVRCPACQCLRDGCASQVAPGSDWCTPCLAALRDPELAT